MASPVYGHRLWAPPVARYKHLSLNDISDEMLSCNRTFYSMLRILRRVWGNLRGHRQLLISLVGNPSFRRNSQLSCEVYTAFRRYLGDRHERVRGVQGKPSASTEKQTSHGLNRWLGRS
jgi:hypothetical protein